MNIEGGSHPNHNDAGKGVAVLKHPALLFGSADTDEKQVGAGAPNRFLNLLVFLLGERAKRRRMPAYNSQAGKALAKPGLERRQNKVVAAIKVDTMPMLSRASADSSISVGP